MVRIPDNGERFDEPRVRQILRRAIEIDQRVSNRIDADELRAIAASVGISAEALDQALAEMRRAEKARKRALKTLRRVRRLLAAAGAVVLGLLTTILSAFSGGAVGGAMMLTTVALLTAMVLMLAVYNRVRGDQRTYQIDNAVIWALFVLASRGANVGGMIPPGLIAWLALAVLGVLVIGRRQSEPPRLGREAVVDQVVGFLRAGSKQEGPAERSGLGAGKEEWSGDCGGVVVTPS
jgi:hypothetical protein